MSALVMATVIPAGGNLEEADAEPIVVELERGDVILVLDDGTRLVVDRAELAAAIAPAAQGWGRDAA